MLRMSANDPERTSTSRPKRRTVFFNLHLIEQQVTGHQSASQPNCDHAYVNVTRKAAGRCRGSLWCLDR